MVNTTHIPAHVQEIIHHDSSHSDVTIRVDSYAQLTLFVQPNNNVTYNIAIADHASCRCYIFIDSQINLNISLELGYQSEAEIRGICIVDGQKVEITTTQHHKAAQASSRLLIKSILYNKAELNYNGTIRIDPHASASYAEQYNKNLICSSDARACAVPSLEVLTHDVSCKHGSATAQLSEEHIVYLTSRGMNDTAAQLLLKEAFCGEILESITDQAVRQEWYSMLKKRINNE